MKLIHSEFPQSRQHLPEWPMLNQPLHMLDGTVLRNRLAKSSMSEALGTYDNHATLELVELYRRWAASGVGLPLQ